MPEPRKYGRSQESRKRRGGWGASLTPGFGLESSTKHTYTRTCTHTHMHTQECLAAERSRPLLEEVGPLVGGGRPLLAAAAAVAQFQVRAGVCVCVCVCV